MNRLLVVDDDHSLRTVLKDALTSAGYYVDVAKSGKAALKMMTTESYELIISDLMMPEMSGIDLLEILRKEYPEVGVLIITAYGTVETAVEALHKGAFDFITKPFSISQIKSRVHRFFDYQELRDENAELKRKLSFDEKFVKLIGNSTAMQQIFHQISIVARTDVPVFIQGESGTGKELIAQAIHDNSIRANRPFLKVNCSAIPETLFESTLFGHEKGAFTNALKMHKGLFEEAHTGTLLLDEISEIPITMQAKLLRVLQERVVTRVGNTRETPIDVRVVATSNRNIEELIEKDEFRSDLFFRLNVFPITVPSLRSRPDDIPLLVDHFLKKLQVKYEYELKEVEKETMNGLMQQPWPGNVRQLENLIERAILYSGTDPILELHHFSLDREKVHADHDDITDAPITIAEMEKRLIFSTLKKTHNNRTYAASLLGISVRTLRNKLHQYADEEMENAS